MQHTLTLTILLEGLEVEKQSLLEHLGAKHRKLQLKFARDIEELKPWEVKQMNEEAEDLKRLVGFIKQTENVITALEKESLDYQDGARAAYDSAKFWHENFLRTTQNNIQVLEIVTPLLEAKQHAA